MSERHHRPYLLHILDAIKSIDEYIHGKTYRAFLKDRRTQDAVIRQLTIIGEATKHIPEYWRSKVGNVPWRHITGMRDVLVHDYFGIDLKEVWGAARNDLKPFQRVIENLLKVVPEE